MASEEGVIIRKIRASDDTKIASIIRRSLEEFGAVKPGTVYFDETTDHLHLVFKTKDSVYFIAEINGEVVGGAGLFPTKGLPEGTCELVKMYVSFSSRGKGLGQLLLDECMREAKAIGYKTVYIETMPELVNAIQMYKKNGFDFIPASLGNSGHTGCDLFMTKEL